MNRTIRFSWLSRSLALLFTLVPLLTLSPFHLVALSRCAAQEYSTGTGALHARGRGPAVLTPVEAFGVHPPGPDPAYNRRCFFRRWRFSFIPYYAPASPTASSVRWKPWCYFPLLPYYTPYYIGYCPHRLCKRKPLPYGFDGGWGWGPRPEAPLPDGPSRTPLRYGAYSSVLVNETAFWNMGGNGLVPYGTPRPPHSGPPDLVDMIQVSRKQGGFCPPSPAIAPSAAWSGEAAPAIAPPTEDVEDKKDLNSDTEHQEEAPAVTPPAEEPALSEKNGEW